MQVSVCDRETEGKFVEDRICPVEPGKFVVWRVDERKTDQRVGISAVG